MTDRDLHILTEEPLNAETVLHRMTGFVTPAGRHYVRTHFPIPDAPAEIRVDGAVRTPTSMTIGELRARTRKTLAVTLECAGNGRKFLDPPVHGEQWGIGAVGTSEWTGSPLAAVLAAAVLPPAKEVLFRGADEGVPIDLGRRIAYERSLPIEVALSPEVLVAYEMNGAPIPGEHGGPLRLIVPGWYGMASVKWLDRITVLDEPFGGFFQRDRYVIDGQPLRAIRPRAVITSPATGAELRGQRLTVKGYAWSGEAPIVHVEVAADPASGVEALSRWREARLGPARGDRAWREFELELQPMMAGSGTTAIELTARATDAAGNTQPLLPTWNALGYANNAVLPVRVTLAAG